MFTAMFQNICIFSGLSCIRIWFTATFQDFFVFFRILKPTFTIFYLNFFPRICGIQVKTLG